MRDKENMVFVVCISWCPSPATMDRSGVGVTLQFLNHNTFLPIQNAITTPNTTQIATGPYSLFLTKSIVGVNSIFSKTNPPAMYGNDTINSGFNANALAILKCSS